MAKLHTHQNEVSNWYLSNFSLFEEELNGSKKAPFHETRKAAITRFSELGFPHSKDEEWRYTSVAPLLQHKFKLSAASEKVTASTIEGIRFSALVKACLVFVNGRFSAELSSMPAQADGVIVTSLKKAFGQHADLTENYLGKYADFDREAFTALNTAFTVDGSLIYVPADTVVPEPIQIIYLHDGQDASVAHPRNLIIASRGSQLKVIESYHSTNDTTYFNNCVTEFVVGENANVEHIKLQEEGTAAFHISNTQIHQEQNSVFSQVNLDLGGSLVRNNTNVTLAGTNCEAHLFGFFLGVDTQHIDNHTFVDHAMPHCFSNELYKGILGDKSKGVFNGKILVRQDAQKTNALQSNKTLLLTNDAVIHAKPQLEIFADDVKCTHGATVGQLDDEALFYLRARGISEEVAGAMLRHAFISDVLGNIGIPELRDILDHRIIEHFKTIA